MRKAAFLTLTLLSAPAVWAAVLPFDLAASTGGAHSLAQGGPALYRGEWTADTRNTWTDNDGNKRERYEVYASNVTYLDGPRKTTADTEPAPGEEAF